MKKALLVFSFFTILTGLAYPLLMWALGQALFPHQANGSMVYLNNEPRGSSLIGQKFSSDRYFWGRPSAVDYKLPSGGSNLSPSSKKLIETVHERIKLLKEKNGKETVPVDLVYASGSGFDPEISNEAALYQLERIVKARNLTEEQKRQIQNLIQFYTVKNSWKIIPIPRVSVLELNLALDREFP